MANPKKIAAVEGIVERFREANAVVLTEYRGLTVQQMKDLRTRLGSDVKYAVVKNTLAKIAAKEVGLDSLVGNLSGPTAIAYVKGDPVAAAKTLSTFAKENPLLVLKGGVMDGNELSADDIKKLASLESREVLLAKSAGVLKALMYQAAYMFTAPASKAVRTVDALREKQEAA
ncbi:MAG: 50S ribosomal protein L10 [Actinomycetaceae bacterium]|nr:50S ribosomal protein L10 [Actinomycetaceae bacterium]